MSPNGGGEPAARWPTRSRPSGAPSTTSKKAFQASAVGNFGSAWTWLVKGRRLGRHRQHGRRRHPLTTGDTPLLCIDVWGTRLLHRLPQPSSGLRRHLPRQAGQSGLRGEELRLIPEPARRPAVLDAKATRVVAFVLYGLVRASAPARLPPPRRGADRRDTRCSRSSTATTGWLRSTNLPDCSWFTGRSPRTRNASPVQLLRDQIGRQRVSRPPPGSRHLGRAAVRARPRGGAQTPSASRRRRWTSATWRSCAVIRPSTA